MRNNTLFSIVMDCSYSQNKLTVYEIQQLLWSYVSVRMRLSDRKAAKDFHAAAARLSIDLNATEHFLSAPFFETKVGLRQFLNDQQHLSHFNPLFVIVNPEKFCSKPNIEKTQLENMEIFFKKLQTPCQIVIKREEACGDGNIFISIENNDFKGFLEVIKTHLSENKFSNLNEDIVIEQCLNMSLQDGKAITHRIAFGAMLNENNIIEINYTVVFRDYHHGFNSQHGKYGRSSFIDHRYYQCENGIPAKAFSIPENDLIERNIIESDPSLKMQIQQLSESIIRHFFDNNYELTAVSHQDKKNPFNILKHENTFHYPEETITQTNHFFREGLSQRLLENNVSQIKKMRLREKTNLQHATLANDLGIKKLRITVTSEENVALSDCKTIKLFCALLIKHFLLSQLIIPSDTFLSNIIPAILEKKDFNKVKKIILHALYPNEDSDALSDRLLINITAQQLKSFIELPLSIPENLQAEYNTDQINTAFAKFN